MIWYFKLDIYFRFWKTLKTHWSFSWKPAKDQFHKIDQTCISHHLVFLNSLTVGEANRGENGWEKVYGWLQLNWFMHSSIFSQFRWKANDSASWMMMMMNSASFPQTRFHHFILKESCSSYHKTYPCISQVSIYTFVFI